jgi:hypothetical protein
MGELLTPTHMMVVAVVAFVLFGGKRVSAPGYNRLIERANDLWADATANAHSHQIIFHLSESSQHVLSVSDLIVIGG